MREVPRVIQAFGLELGPPSGAALVKDVLVPAAEAAGAVGAASPLHRYRQGVEARHRPLRRGPARRRSADTRTASTPPRTGSRTPSCTGT